jgi:hypothetical protein
VADLKDGLLPTNWIYLNGKDPTETSAWLVGAVVKNPIHFHGLLAQYRISDTFTRQLKEKSVIEPTWNGAEVC